MFVISAQTFSKNLISVGFHQKLHRAPRKGKTAHLIGCGGALAMSSAPSRPPGRDAERTWASQGGLISRDPVQLGGTASGGTDWDDLERKYAAIKQQRSTARCYVRLCCN